MSGTLLLVGATSDIGHAVAARYAEAGWRILLAARDPERAQRNADDLEARHRAEVALLRLDIFESERFAAWLDGLPVLPDTVVCAVGELGDQGRAEADPAHAEQVLRTNFLGPSLLLGLVAERFAARGSGTIVGISSVAGDRGRGSNYVYGAGKAGFTAFLSGLRNRLTKSGVRVVTVKPGFVRTRMTRGLRLPPLLTAEPSEVGQAVYAAAQGRGSDVVYVRRVWRLVMTVIGAIPEPVFKRLSL
ncbi:short-chain dehydrogenase [Methylobacterium sp. Leaf123]|uniref:SDR family oxidoreductase n=1 Tax=Methylobacterium sp. Leaf123 TaxID=1736264 RepID=UPI0006F9A96E|nr:SDR family oxidoreductase [Methylobacterium sp. Leaf123]KQQ12047.1 short-chain dehydrogenase [Methylobacterium sp. Leaf123]